MPYLILKTLLKKCATLRVPIMILLALPASTNYKLNDYGFGSGGSGGSSSTNYKVTGVTGEEGNGQSASTNYKIGPGLIQTQQADVPGTPTLENLNSSYNRLHFVIAPDNNPTDALFAIAISTDDFVTTNYIQNDNTIGAVLGSEDYQTYANWGGVSGENVIALVQDTTYKIKVKAMHGIYTETGYGPIATAATLNPNITFSIAGVNSGVSLEGVITDITTSANQASFGELGFNQVKEGASTLSLTTNAISGYTVTVAQTGTLTSDKGAVFPTVSGTNASPSAWPSSVLTGAYGYHSSDATLGTGTTTRFSADNSFAQFEATAREVAYSSGAVTDEATSMIYSIEAGYDQEAGSYSHVITYIATGIF